MNYVSVTKIAKTASQALPVSVDVAIGYGQRADTIIYIGGLKLISFEDSMAAVDLGSDVSLKGKTVVVQTTVYDIQKQTNQTSVDIAVSGLPAVLNIPMNFTVQTEGEVVSYTANLVFI